MNIEDGDSKDSIVLFLKNPSIFQSKYINGIENFDNKKDAGSLSSSLVSNVIWADGIYINPENSNKYIVFYRPIANYRENVGILEVKINLKKLDNYIKLANGNENYIFSVYDKNNNLIDTASNGGGNGGKGISVKEKIISGYAVECFLPRKYITKEYFSAAVPVFLWLILITLIIIAVSRYISNSITSRLNTFIENLETHKSGIKMNTEVGSKDEISILENRFKLLLSDIDKMHLSEKKLKSRIEISHFELLQAKINPHLLYNSLSAIRWEALRTGENTICEIVDILTAYYRGIFSYSEHVVTVSEELNIVKNYLEVTRLSYKMNYGIHYEISGDIKNEYMYKMILQPVVENAVCHGIHDKPDGKITVKGCKENNSIIFVIEDNGYGMKKDVLKSITGGVKSGKHYGINNIRERLDLFYNKEGTVTVESVLGEGTRVIIKLPAEDKETLKKRLETY
jgi:sensor histidine kinase YesM